MMLLAQTPVPSLPAVLFILLLPAAVLAVVAYLFIKKV